jgi:hypothetical protein
MSDQLSREDAIVEAALDLLPRLAFHPRAAPLKIRQTLGTCYTHGTPPDPIVEVGLFKTLELTLTSDHIQPLRP